MNVFVVEIDNESEAKKRISSTGSDPYGVSLMFRDGFMRPVLLKSVDNRAANIIKQEVLSVGGEAALSRDVSCFKKGKTDVLIMATSAHYKRFLPKFSIQPFGLKEWGKSISIALLNYEKSDFSVPCGKYKLKLGDVPKVMGILNVTPDSFCDGGIYSSTDDACVHAQSMAGQGADIIDIGGESTRPGAKPVTAEEEIKRVLPVLKKLVKNINVPLSIDTYKPEVAQAALDAGAAIVNDITGLRYKKGLMANVVADYGASVIIMHMTGTPGTMQKNPKYKDVVSEIGRFFELQTEFAIKKGIPRERIILDPGIGFGKSQAHNLEILRRLKEFRALGLPLAIGTSKKSFIGNVLGGLPASERLSGTLSSCVWAALQGVKILRVHDVAEIVQAVKIIDGIKSGGCIQC